MTTGYGGLAETGWLEFMFNSVGERGSLWVLSLLPWTVVILLAVMNIGCECDGDGNMRNLHKALLT